MTKKFKLSILIVTILMLVTLITACSGVKFEVNFMVDGKVYKTIDTSGKEMVEMPPNPTKKGYVFDGWYWDEGTWEQPFTANSILDAPLSSNMNVYAKWKTADEANKGEHSHNYVQTVTEPTCMNSGFTTYVCECGESYVDSYVDALEHKFINFKADGKPGNNKHNSRTAYCEYGCGTKLTENDNDSNRLHDFINYVYNNDATCELNGTETAKCKDKKCEATNTREVENTALGHSFTQYSYNNDSRPGFAGTETALCDNNGCDKTYTRIVGTHEPWDDSQHTHVYTNYVYNNDAKCGIDGTETAVCDFNGCSETETRSKVGSALSHEFINYVYNNDAKCGVDGTKTGVCKHAGCGEQETIVAVGTSLSHQYTNYISNGDAKCGINGTETAICDRDNCYSTNTRTQINSALSHLFVSYISNNDATCSRDGTETATCGNNGCQVTDTRTDVGSKIDHAFETYVPNGDAKCGIDGTKTATCKYDGCNVKDTIADVGSARSHKFINYNYNGDATCFKDGSETATCDYADCSVTDIRTKVGTKLEHIFMYYSYNNDATCTKDGTEMAPCSHGCGETHTQIKEGTKLSHVYTNYVYNHDATCFANGTETGTCSYNCGATNTRASANTKLSHEFKIYTYNNNATCTVNGTESASCYHGCGTIDVREKADTALGHDFIDYVYNENATCGVCGTETGKCSREGCDATNERQKPGSALPHSFSTYVYDNNATCGVNGTETAKCDNCDITDSRRKEGTALAHDFSNYVSNNDATCTVNGTEKAQCANGCGAESIRTEANSATGHNFVVYEIHTHATCESDGVEISVCSNGNCKVTDIRIAEGSALGHDFGEYVSQNNATCLGDATAVAECKRTGCHKTDVQTLEGTALGHSFTKYVADGMGTKTAYCDRGCGAKHTTIDENYEAEEPMIAFGNLLLNGNNLSDVVSNVTDTYDFNEVVVVTGGAEYNMYSDIECTNEIRSKIITLAEGDNVCYLIAVVGEEKTTYTINIRRRPIYTVSFNTNGADAIESQYVEEGMLAVEPIISRYGYTFLGWDYNFAQAITGNVVINANWQANLANYTTNYYVENVENDEYTLRESTISSGVIGEEARAEVRWYSYFTVENDDVRGEIVADNSLVLNVYYQRNEFTVTFNLVNNSAYGITYVNGPTTVRVKYQGTATAPEFRNDGYDFAGFTRSLNNITSDVTISARWNAIYYVNGSVITGLTSYGRTLTELNVPAKVGAQSVNSIASKAFSNATKLNKVVIDDAITSIGEGAFSGCNYITDMVLPFVGASKTASAGYDQAFGYIFGYEKKLPLFTVSGAIKQCTTGGYWYYYYIPATIRNITINGGTINAKALSAMPGLRSVTIGNGVTAIGRGALKDCTSLESLTIPFVGASKTASNGYDEVLGYIFDYTTNTAGGSLSGTTLQYSKRTTTKLEDGTTSTTTTYYYYYIPESLRTLNIGGGAIDANVFRGCDMLTKITLDTGVTDIDARAFDDCNTSIYTTENSIRYLGNEDNPYRVAVGYTGSSSSITLHEDCEMVAKNAFASNVSYMYYPDTIGLLSKQVLVPYCEMRNTWGSVIEKSEEYTYTANITDDNYKRAAFGGVIRIRSFFTVSNNGNHSSSWFIETLGGTSRLILPQQYVSLGQYISASYILPGGTNTIIGYLNLRTQGKPATQQTARVENCGFMLINTDFTAPDIMPNNATLIDGKYWQNNNVVRVADSGAGIYQINVRYTNLSGVVSTSTGLDYIATGTTYVTNRTLALQAFGQYDITVVDNVGNTSTKTIWYYGAEVNVKADDSTHGSAYVTTSSSNSGTMSHISNLYASQKYYMYAEAKQGYYFAGWTGLTTLDAGEYVDNKWRQEQSISSLPSTTTFNWEARFVDIVTLLRLNGENIAPGMTSFVIDYTGNSVNLTPGDLPTGYTMSISYEGETSQGTAYSSTVAPVEKGSYLVQVNVMYKGNAIGNASYTLSIV